MCAINLNFEHAEAHVLLLGNPNDAGQLTWLAFEGVGKPTLKQVAFMFNLSIILLAFLQHCDFVEYRVFKDNMAWTSQGYVLLLYYVF